jgi:hypothetical protein
MSATVALSLYKAALLNKLMSTTQYSTCTYDTQQHNPTCVLAFLASSMVGFVTAALARKLN